MTKADLEVFFIGILERESSMSEIRTEIKEAFNSFASSHECDVKALQDGFRYHKRAMKNEQDARAAEFERDKLIELLIAEVPDAGTTEAMPQI